MTSRVAVERAFFAEHPGAVFDEGYHTTVPAGRDQVLALERAVAKLPQFEFPIRNYFVDGLYVREIFIPRGAVLVGYIHTKPCVTTVSRGEIIIYDGELRARVRAPYTVCVAAGTKKAGFAVEDTVWSDAYANPDNERDIPTLEARLTANTHEEYLLRLGTK